MADIDDRVPPLLCRAMHLGSGQLEVPAALLAFHSSPFRSPQAVTGLDLPLLPRFLSSLFHLTQDESPGVRRAVCQGLAFMLTGACGVWHR